MPDLITHISLNYIIYQLIRKHFTLTLFLFGTIAADLFVGLQLFLIDGLHVKQVEEVFTLNGFSHSLFGGLLISLMIGLLFYPQKKAVTSIFVGYLFHLVLDFLQTNWGKGNLLLYPFSFQTFTFDLFTYGVDFKFVYVIIPFLIFVFILLKEKEILYLSFSLKNIILSMACLIFAMIIFFSFFQKTLYSDFFYLNFRFHPQDYDGQIIKMNSVKLKSTHPPIVIFRRHTLVLNKVNIKINPRYRYRISGIYHHRDKTVDVTKIYLCPTYKMMISGMGILLFLLFILFKVKIKLWPMRSSY